MAKSRFAGIFMLFRFLFESWGSPSLDARFVLPFLQFAHNMAEGTGPTEAARSFDDHENGSHSLPNCQQYLL